MFQEAGLLGKRDSGTGSNWVDSSDWEPKRIGSASSELPSWDPRATSGTLQHFVPLKIPLFRYADGKTTHNPPGRKVDQLLFYR